MADRAPMILAIFAVLVVGFHAGSIVFEKDEEPGLPWQDERIRSMHARKWTAEERTTEVEVLKRQIDARLRRFDRLVQELDVTRREVGEVQQILTGRDRDSEASGLRARLGAQQRTLKRLEAVHADMQRDFSPPLALPRDTDRVR